MKETRLYIQQEQVDRLKEIGSSLRESRHKQSLSLEDVAAKTRIQPRLLKAIEEGRIEILPEPIYIQGFIKRFADALDLNGEELANAYPSWPTQLFIKPSWLQLPTAQLRPIHLYFFYILLVIGAVNGLSYVVNQSTMQASNAQTYRQQDGKLGIEGTQVQATSPESLEPLKLTEISHANKTDKPVRVDVKLTSPSWIRVVADGKTKFEGVLNEGEQRTWEAKEQLTVRAGNAGGVLVAFNEQKAREMGAPNRVKELTFEAERKS